MCETILAQAEPKAWIGVGVALAVGLGLLLTGRHARAAAARPITVAPPP